MPRGSACFPSGGEPGAGSRSQGGRPEAVSTGRTVCFPFGLPSCRRTGYGAGRLGADATLGAGRARVVGVRFSVLLPRGLPLAATGERRVGLRSVRRRQHADSKARRAGRPAALRRPARQSGADRRPAMGTVRGRARRGGRSPNRSDPAVRVGRPLRMFAGRRKRSLVCD